MRAWVCLALLALFLPFVVSYEQFVYLSPNDKIVTIEKQEESKLDCKFFDILPVDTPNHNMSRIFDLACGLKTRPARFIHHIPVLNLFFPGEEPIVPMNESEVYRRASALHKILHMVNIDAVSFEEFHSLTKWNGSGMLFHFNYPDQKESDAWLVMPIKRLRCDHLRNYSLQVCGMVNPGRTWGYRKYAIPMVKFAETGEIFEVMDVPLYAAYTDKSSYTSIKRCRELITYAECIIPNSTEACSIDNYTNCKRTRKIAMNKVFVREFGEYTVVAAFYQNYTTFINGTYATHPIDISHHVVLRLPEGSFAVFGDFKVWGRGRDNYDHFTIHSSVDSLKMTAEDLDDLQKEYGDRVAIEDSRQLLERDEPFYKRHAFFILFGLICVIAILGSILCVSAMKNKKKDHNAGERPSHANEPTVLFSQGNCEIITY